MVGNAVKDQCRDRQNGHGPLHVIGDLPTDLPAQVGDPHPELRNQTTDSDLGGGEAQIPGPVTHCLGEEDVW